MPQLPHTDFRHVSDHRFVTDFFLSPATEFWSVHRHAKWAVFQGASFGLSLPIIASAACPIWLTGSASVSVVAFAIRVLRRMHRPHVPRVGHFRGPCHRFGLPAFFRRLLGAFYAAAFSGQAAFLYRMFRGAARAWAFW